LADGRHASKSSRIKPATLIIGGVVAVIAVVIAIVLLSGGADSLPGIGPDTPETPEFAFEAAKVIAVPTRADAQDGELDPKAGPVAAEVEDAMDALYIRAFLDPGNWQEGAYDDVWELFEPGAGAEAQAQVDTLTAGTGAGDAFDEIQPTLGTLQIKVLFDQQDRAFSAVAIVRFGARGKSKEGPDVRIRSEGQFVFEQLDGVWKVVSFRVLRHNDLLEPSVSASASASASGSPS
jgi:hypothetical protein